jgi:N,N'-diacetyl-8-epilegionaminate cytidylyltransferase
MKKSDFKAICFIFARGGSKGLPGKNIKVLGGKPLIAYSIDIARKNPRLESVIVSTDDPAIAEVARAYGAEVPFMRPSEMATDTAPEWQAWRHAVKWYQRERGEFDIFLSLPATSPFRSQEDVDACLDLLAQDPNADGVITVRDAERSPYFNMVTLNDSGYAKLIIPHTGNIVRRQDAPEVFDVTTIAYAVRPAYILNGERLFDGRLRMVRVPSERALDIDTPYDFMIAQAIVDHLLINSA